jgi:hypothetical protein
MCFCEFRFVEKELFVKLFSRTKADNFDVDIVAFF